MLQVNQRKGRTARDRLTAGMNPRPSTFFVFAMTSSLAHQFRMVRFDPLFHFAANLKREGERSLGLHVRDGPAHFVRALITLFSQGVDPLHKFPAGIDREFEGLNGVVMLVSSSRGPVARRSQDGCGRRGDRVVSDEEAGIGGKFFRLLIVGYLRVCDAQQVADFVGTASVRAEPAVSLKAL